MESINRQKDDEIRRKQQYPSSIGNMVFTLNPWNMRYDLKVRIELRVAVAALGDTHQRPGAADNRQQTRVPWPLSTPESAMSWWQLESFLSWRLAGFANVSSEDQRQRETSGGSTSSLAATRQPSQEKINFRDDIGLQRNLFAD